MYTYIYSKNIQLEYMYVCMYYVWGWGVYVCILCVYILNNKRVCGVYINIFKAYIDVLKFMWNHKRPPNSQNNPENRTMLKNLSFQILSYSNKNNMVLAQKQMCR